MKKLIWIFCSVILAACLVLIFPTEASAAEIVENGTCGDNLTWTLDDEGALKISGTGPMYDWNYDNHWKENKDAIMSVFIENGVTDIGSDAFEYCDNLTSIMIPDSVTRIGDGAFAHCSSLMSITIPDSVTSIGRYAFIYCPNLKCNIYNNVRYLGNNEKPYIALIGANHNLTSYEIHSETKFILDHAFDGCTSLINITIPDGVISISESAFYNCTSLTSVTIQDGVNSIGAYAFSNCKNLTTIRIPDSVSRISWSVFECCTSLIFNVYDNAKYLGNENNPYAMLVESVTDDVSSCQIHTETKVINAQAFQNCKNLTEIVIPNSITGISRQAFYGCTSLRCVTIGSGVTQIGDIAFGECTELTDVFYCGSQKQWGDVLDEGGNYDLTYANWHYAVDNTVFAEQNCNYCPDCDNYFLPNGEYALATITFLNWDGTEIDRQLVKYKEDVIAPADPVKAADNTYTYSFAGWDKNVVACTGNMTYTATYTPEYIDYTVIFADEDGTELFKNIYHWGDAVTVPTDPAKAADNTYTYTFVGWDQNVVNCAGNVTYTAIYTQKYIDYTVIFADEDGTKLSENTYHWGDTVNLPDVPVKAADNTYTYTFAGWNQEVVACAGNATYTATYTPNYIDYTVIFCNFDGTVLSTAKYHYGDAVTEPLAQKAPDMVFRYVFAGWDKPVTVCQENTTYTAVFEPEHIEYVVTFYDWDGSVIDSKTYHYGDKVGVPEDPARGNKDGCNYTFKNWGKAIGSCTGDAEYTAVYDMEYIDYTVVFKDWNGTQLSSKTYHWSDTVEEPTEPSRPHETFSFYIFTGWDKEVTPCNGDAVYTATYTAASFADIATNSWQFTSTKYVYERGLMAGKGTDAYGRVVFDPNKPISREEFVQVLYNAEGKPSVDFVYNFLDVKDSWYKNAVLWGKKNDIANGTPDGNFGVGKNISRQDLALMLYKYAKLKDYSLEVVDGRVDQFADGDKVADYAKTAMNWAVTNGILSGKGTAGADISTFYLDPAGTATRAECAAMLKNFMTAFGL